MATIDVSLAEAGMILAADVVDKRGRLLIPAGKELSERHVGALSQWGVDRIEVEGDGPEGAGGGEVEPWAVDQAAAEVDLLFSRVNRDHPMMAALADACVQRKAALIQADAPDGAPSADAAPGDSAPPSAPDGGTP